eukprot:snap_masked-scaffold_43-processed-gene-1.48-mRNA-1 protein AED:1.00 eAED:1.00 QI:0/0/0/0/1/1/2/0/558
MKILLTERNSLICADKMGINIIEGVNKFFFITSNLLDEDKMKKFLDSWCENQIESAKTVDLCVYSTKPTLNFEKILEALTHILQYMVTRNSQLNFHIELIFSSDRAQLEQENLMKKTDKIWIKDMLKSSLTSEAMNITVSALILDPRIWEFNIGRFGVHWYGHLDDVFPLLPYRLSNPENYHGNMNPYTDLDANEINSLKNSWCKQKDVSIGENIFSLGLSSGLIGNKLAQLSSNVFSTPNSVMLLMDRHKIGFLDVNEQYCKEELLKKGLLQGDEKFISLLLFNSLSDIESALRRLKGRNKDVTNFDKVLNLSQRNQVENPSKGEKLYTMFLGLIKKALNGDLGFSSSLEDFEGYLQSYLHVLEEKVNSQGVWLPENLLQAYLLDKLGNFQPELLLNKIKQLQAGTKIRISEVLLGLSELDATIFTDFKQCKYEPEHIARGSRPLGIGLFQRKPATEHNPFAGSLRLIEATESSPNIVFFILGGITLNEIERCSKIVKENFPYKRVILAGNKITSIHEISKDLLTYVPNEFSETTEKPKTEHVVNQAKEIKSLFSNF